jgi:FAD:protein FMN transferase
VSSRVASGTIEFVRQSSVFVGLLALAVTPSASPRTALARYDASRLSMACVYAIVAYGEDGEALPRAVEGALAEVDRIDRLMSHYRRDSPLSDLNRNAADGPVAVEPELFDFIARAVQYSRDSEGAFDITVGPLMKAWGFFGGEGRVPSDAELRVARRLVGYRHVVLNASERTIRFDAEGIELDLGGIAKGYAVDRALGVLARHRVRAALISAGGSTIYGLGAPPGHEAWEIRIQDPMAPHRIAFTVALKDRALSIAGSSEKFFESGGKRYSHIMDPRSGRPVEGLLSVVVLASSGTAGDALDDALFVQGVEKSRAYLTRLADTEAYFLLPTPRHGWTTVHVRPKLE